MTRSELIAEIAAASPSLRDEDIATVVVKIFNEIASALARGDRVELRGWAAIQGMGKPSVLGFVQNAPYPTDRRQLARMTGLMSRLPQQLPHTRQ